jgi:glycosyltransferase involved in cell wall biosynthesis
MIKQAGLIFNEITGMKILFVISSTVSGGAEKQLVELLKITRIDHEVSLLVLATRGSMSAVYEDIGIPVQHMSSNKFYGLVVEMLGICKIIKEFKPDIVQTFLYKADILTTIVGKFSSQKRIFWTAGNTAIPSFHFWKKLPLSLLSRKFTKGVFANSMQAQEFHEKIGYPKKIFVQVPNFLPRSLENKPKVRDPRIHSSELRVGLAARAVEGKGHLTLLRAAREIKNQGRNIKLSFIGEGIQDWTELKDQISNLEISNSVELLAVQDDITDWYLHLDLFVLASEMWESFPNVLAEAVTLNVPVISSDVANIALEIFDLRDTFQAGSYEQLAGKICEFADRSQLEVSIESTRLNRHLHSKYQNIETYKIWEKSWLTP